VLAVIVSHARLPPRTARAVCLDVALACAARDAAGRAVKQRGPRPRRRGRRRGGWRVPVWSGIGRGG
jgi:hypothetical protein